MFKSKKNITIFLSILLCSPQLIANMGAVDHINTNMTQNVVATGASQVYVGKNSAQCGWRSPMPCIRAAMGIMQIAQLIMQLRNSHGKQQQFGIGTLPTPEDYGLCLNPAASGCTQDPVDVQIADSPIGTALQSGDPDNFLSKLNESAEDLKRIEADLNSKGYFIDRGAGTITGPDGKPQSIASLASDPNYSSMPSSAASAVSSKIASIQKAANARSGGSGSGNAKNKGAAGGAGGLNFVDEFVDEDLKAKKRALASLNKKKKTNEDFLAAMADKAGNGAIGVAGDDLFKMIQRRYNKKKKAEEFIFR